MVLPRYLRTSRLPSKLRLTRRVGCSKNLRFNLMTLILHNIRSVYNVGSIFRTADCAGVEKIYLTGYTPAPVDRFGRRRKDFHKSALGAEDWVPWEQCDDISELIYELRTMNYEVIALEQSPRSVDYKKFRPKGKLAMIAGNEGEGVEKGVLDKCDKIIEIPMKGKKESLNVSVAVGIALFNMKLGLADDQLDRKAG